MGKVRRIDFYPDEFIAGVFGQMTGMQCGVYWVLCAYMASAGGPVREDHDLVARCLKMRRPDVAAAINHLVSTGKLQRTEDEGGVWLYQKRIEREVSAALKRIETNTDNARGNGKDKGKQRASRAVAKSSAKPPATITTNHQPPTTISRKKEASSGDDGSPDGFNEWWEVFPRKVGKGAARQAYSEALSKTTAADLLVACRLHAAACKGEDIKFTPHPDTWLIDERWLDCAPSGAVIGSAEYVSVDATLEQWMPDFKRQFHAATFNSWFAKCTLARRGDVFTLVAPSLFFANYIHDNYLGQLKEIFEGYQLQIDHARPTNATPTAAEQAA